jgi:hypothetical protein
MMFVAAHKRIFFGFASTFDRAGEASVMGRFRHVQNECRFVETASFFRDPSGR